MAIHIALYGGLGIIHCNNTIEGAGRLACCPRRRATGQPFACAPAAQSNASRCGA
jgi:hypothetical protein